jgi:hypothetical protein
MSFNGRLAMPTVGFLATAAFAVLAASAALTASHAGTQRDWKVLSQFTGDETLAVDLLSEKDGRLTVMLDDGFFNGHSKGSMIADYEVKCAQSKFRVDASAEFSDTEGTGKVHVIHAHPTEWQNTNDPTLSEETQAILGRACTSFEERH